MPLFAPLVTTAIVLGYAGSLWWLLRSETRVAVLALLALCLASATIRLAYTEDYPAGLHEDEPKIFASVIEMSARGEWMKEDSTGLPVFLNGLFQAQLVPVFGTGRWSIRFYSLVTGVLATPVAFAVARAMGLSAGAGLAAGALLAVLPWSVFWGRVSMGGELPFHQLLLLAGVARLIWTRGGAAEVGMASLGLGLLLYDYWAGRTMLGMPLVGAVLATGRRRLWCLAILALAVAAWWPYIGSHPPHGLTGVTASLIHPGLAEEPLATVVAKTAGTLEAFVEPVATNGALTVAAAGMHPPLILAVGFLGAFRGARRALFLWGGFLGGLLPTIISAGENPSAHRMMMAFPFIVLSAANAIDLLRWPRVRHAVAAVIVAVVGVQSLRLYFSDDFWRLESRWPFDWELTALVEALPPPPAPGLIVAQDVGFYFHPRAAVDQSYELLRVQNWYPRNDTPLVYAYGKHHHPLLPFYERLLGPERIEIFGRAFLLRLEPADWSWLKRHGWAYEAQCGAHVWRSQVPVLYQLFTFNGIYCPGPITHRWRGRWHGPAGRLLLRFSGEVAVDTPRGRLLETSGAPDEVEFDVESETDLTVTLTSPGGTWAAVMQTTPAGPQLPSWELVSPLGSDGAPVSAGQPSPGTGEGMGEGDAIASSHRWFALATTLCGGGLRPRCRIPLTPPLSRSGRGKPTAPQHVDESERVPELFSPRWAGRRREEERCRSARGGRVPIWAPAHARAFRGSKPPATLSAWRRRATAGAPPRRPTSAAKETS